MWEAFLLPQTAAGAPGQPDQQVIFWWPSSPGPEQVLSPSCGSTVRASWGHMVVPGPPALLSTPPVESIPHLLPADRPTRQFEFHIGSSGRKKKKDSSLPQKPSAFPAAQASPPRLGCALASKGGLNLSCHQPAADPGLSDGLRLLQNWQLPRVTSTAHICSGTPLSAVALRAQRLLLAKWLQLGILAYL